MLATAVLLVSLLPLLHVHVVGASVLLATTAHAAADGRHRVDQPRQCDDPRLPCPGYSTPTPIFADNTPGINHDPNAQDIIPSLVYVPPGSGAPNGTLLAFTEWHGPCASHGAINATCTLALKRSLDHGRSWGPASYPVDEAIGIPNPGPNSTWCCPKAEYDERTKAVLLHFSNDTVLPGGCDVGVEQLGGVLQISSTDAGRTFGSFINVQAQLQFPRRPLNCLSTGSGNGLVMRPDSQGNYGGRIMFCSVRNSYMGNVPTWSDDGGKNFNYSSALYRPGLGECSIAQAANGSLFLIARNCWDGDVHSCVLQQQQQQQWRGQQAPHAPGGNHHFVYSVSNDGGVHWTAPRDQPQVSECVRACVRCVCAFAHHLIVFIAPW